jgi:putative sterol carrier protein
MSVETVTQSFKTRAIEFTSLKARVKFDFGDEGCILVDATSSPPAVSDQPGEADCTIKLTLANLEKLMAGALSPTLAYAMGKLKIDGSMGLAMKVAALLDE